MCNTKLIINAEAKLPEINAAKLLKDCFFKKTTLIVGDKTKLPDIYTEDLSVGIEVVQMDTKNDLTSKYLLVAIEKHDGNYNKIINGCKQNILNYYHLIKNDNMVVGFYGKRRPHSKVWMDETYCNNINNKLDKLNKGNYINIKKEIDLCILIVHRTKHKFDADLIAYHYNQIKKRYKKSYHKIYVIESEKTFIIYPSRIKTIEPDYRDGNIIGFNVIGDNYIEEMDIRYSNYID